MKHINSSVSLKQTWVKIIQHYNLDWEVKHKQEKSKRHLETLIKFGIRVVQKEKQKIPMIADRTQDGSWQRNLHH